MAAKRNKYDDYENENKGKMWKVFKPLLIALAIALGVCLLSLALADAGFFPGNLLNRFVVSSFLDEKYGGEIVSYDRYDSASGNFIYKCTVDGKPCEIGAKNFKIRYDGYYHAYGRNKSFEAITEDYLDHYLNGKMAKQYSVMRLPGPVQLIFRSAIPFIPLLKIRKLLGMKNRFKKR